MARKGQRIARIVGVALGVGFLGLFVAASVDRSDETRGPDGSPSASGSPALLEPGRALAGPDLIALLGGLKAGDELAGWKVVAVYGPVERIGHVAFERDGTVFSVGIGRTGSGKALPPISLQNYELGYGNVRGVPPSTPETLAVVAQAVADRVRANEKAVPVPAGM